MALYECEACGIEFEAAKKAKTCSDRCRKRLSRNPAIGTEEDASALVLAVEKELDAAGALESRVGQQALTLAQMMSGKFAVAQGVATISKELDRLVRLAIEECRVELDPLDELKKRRDQKRQHAA